MKQFKLLVGILALTSLSISAFANDPNEGGFGGGNGGDGLVCYDASGAITSIELLDLYEARTERVGMELSADFKNKTRIELEKVFVDRLVAIDPIRAERYKNRIAELETEISALEKSNAMKGTLVRFTNGNLADVPDSFHVTYPKNCKVEQVVIQLKNLLPGDYKFTLQKDLWNLMDATQQAATLAHEVIYEEAILDYSATNSIGVRYLNGALHSDFVADVKAYVTIANAAKIFPNYPFETGKNGYPWVEAFEANKEAFISKIEMDPIFGMYQFGSMKLGRCVLRIKDIIYENYRYRGGSLWKQTGYRVKRKKNVPVGITTALIAVKQGALEESNGLDEYIARAYLSLVEANDCEVLETYPLLTKKGK